MKSIKEKSNEYAREYLFNPFPQKAPNEHFEAGANYAIGKAVEWLKENAEKYVYWMDEEFGGNDLLEDFKKYMED